jgi:hypothetical protein
MRYFVISALLLTTFPLHVLADSGQGSYYQAMAERDQAYSNYYRALRSLPAKATAEDRARLADQHVVPAEASVSKSLHGLIKNKMAENRIFEKGSKEANGRGKSDLSYKPIDVDREPSGFLDKNGAGKAARQKGQGKSIDGSHIPRTQQY